MFDVSLEGANLWFDVSNVVLLVGAVLVALGTYGTIRFAGIKENFSDERVTANEAETKRAVADSDAAKEGTAKANERIAELSTQAEELRKETAGAFARAAEAQLALEKFKAPRTLSNQQKSTITANLLPFAGIVYSRPNRKVIGIISLAGVFVQIERDKTAEFEAPAVFLAGSLNLEGILAKAEAGAVTTAENKNVIHVMVGKKP